MKTEAELVLALIYAAQHEENHAGEEKAWARLSRATMAVLTRMLDRPPTKEEMQQALGL